MKFHFFAGIVRKTRKKIKSKNPKVCDSLLFPISFFPLNYERGNS